MRFILSPFALIVLTGCISLQGETPGKGLLAVQRLDSAAKATLKRLPGAWQGELGPSRLRIVFRFMPAPPESVMGFLDSPGEEHNGIPISALRIDGTTVHLAFASIDATYDGQLAPGRQRIEGTFSQRGSRLSLVMERIDLQTLTYLIPRFNEAGTRQLHYAYHPPQDVGDGWAVERIHPTHERAVSNVMGLILDQTFPGVEGLIVAKDGAIVVEEYFYGFDRDRLHQLRSITKTIASVLTGIALQQGFIDSIDTPVASFYPELAAEHNWDDRKRRMTLKHLLTMTSGFKGNDHEDNYAGTRATMASPDWVQHVMSVPVIVEPGERYAYNGSSLMALSGALEIASGMAVQELAKRYLFGPLGIDNAQWKASPAGTPYLGSGLHLTPRALAKIGLLFLNQGKWQGKRIVSESWVPESTRGHLAWWFPHYRYGYLWWSKSLRYGFLKSVDLFYAAGKGGQKLYVIPEKSMVVVITSGNYTPSSRTIKRQGDEILSYLLDLTVELRG